MKVRHSTLTVIVFIGLSLSGVNYNLSCVSAVDMYVFMHK